MPSLQPPLSLVCALGRLEVDPGKTWMWATCPDHETQLRTALATLFSDPAAISKVHSAKDLGLQMQYQGGPKLGSIRDRLQEGHARITRMHFAKWDIEVKVHILMQSIYATAFHGTEHIPLGPEHLDTFRSKAANAFLQVTNQTMSPIIAFQVISPRLIALVCLSSFKPSDMQDHGFSVQMLLHVLPF